jgi:DNA modification methylase
MVRVLIGDCRTALRGLPDKSVQCVVTSPPYFALRSYLPDSHPDKAAEIGLETTPKEYVAELVAVFREVRRVLRDDGCVWLNLGDSFATAGGYAGGHFPSNVASKSSTNQGSVVKGRKALVAGYKSKDLLMIPAQVALALRADGWYLRSDIIWSKVNPMPESVTDRPTKSHEYVFLLTKKPNYFWDAEAVREPVSSSTIERWGENLPRIRSNGLPTYSRISGENNCGANPAGRNIRSVWSLASQPSSIPHFAIMPNALAEICIKAGSSEAGCCPTCKAPWQRIIEKGEADLEHQLACGGDATGQYFGQSTKGYAAHGVQDASAVKAHILAGMVKKQTVGWQPTCNCPEHQPVPCTVLDPFFGAGTTGLVSARLGRHCIGVELNSDYASQAVQRINDDGLSNGFIQMQVW